MKSNRAVLMSVMQYKTELESGSLTISKLLDKVDKLGVDGVELRRELWPHYAKELPAIREKIDHAGMMVTYATFSTLFNMTAEGHKMLLHDLDTARALGSPLLRVFPGATPPDQHDPRWRSAIEAVAHASSLGIVIALENFGKLPGGHLSEISNILHHIPSSALMTNIDTGNYETHGEDTVTAIQTLAERVVYAHLKDKADARSDGTTYLGGGRSPLKAIVMALEALPQPVLYCFEFVGGGEPDARITRSLAFLRGS